MEIGIEEVAGGCKDGARGCEEGKRSEGTLKIADLKRRGVVGVERGQLKGRERGIHGGVPGKDFVEMSCEDDVAFEDNVFGHLADRRSKVRGECTLVRHVDVTGTGDGGRVDQMGILADVESFVSGWPVDYTGVFNVKG